MCLSAQTIHTLMKSSRLRKIDGLLDQQQALRRKREGDVDEFDDSSTAMAEANKYELKNTYILTNKTLDSLTMMAFMVLVCPVLYMILHYTIIHFVGTDSSTVNINEADARVFCIIIVSVTVFHALHELVRFSSSHLSWKFVTGLSFAIHFMCSFCYCMIEYDLSPVVSTVSGRGYYIMRDCMWLFTTPLMIILVSNTIVLPLATVLRLVVWDEVMIVSGLVTNFLPAPYCYITLALSVMFFLFFNYSLYCLHRVAQEEYPLAMQISFVWIHITWCAFPIVWSLGFFDFIDEGMEHTLFALCDITAK